jgi:hypothetical protein
LVCVCWILVSLSFISLSRCGYSLQCILCGHPIDFLVFRRYDFWFFSAACCTNYYLNVNRRYRYAELYAGLSVLTVVVLAAQSNGRTGETLRAGRIYTDGLGLQHQISYLIRRYRGIKLLWLFGTGRRNTIETLEAWNMRNMF